MIIVYPSHHLRHRPPSEIFNGVAEPHAEVPERIEHIRDAVCAISGVRIVLPKHFPLSWIEQVHNPNYVSYLAEAGRLAGNQYMYPSVFPYANHGGVVNAIAKRGEFTFDMYTPVSSTTYQVACGSAMAALTAASVVRRGERVSYALCRPPGHHAEVSRMGGYCYFNNAAVAANYLSTRGKVTVLDIDVHHGNGTQHIFYERSDVQVINIHADPKDKFPFFSGGANETGAGLGSMFNTNYPLSLGTADVAYDRTLVAALKRIREFAPEYLVVSVGYDAHVNDPIGGLRLSTPYYRRMASRIAALNLPTVLVQEGGYNTAKLGLVARTFAEGFLYRQNKLK
ncbi:histone deacetylase family protein [Candidatus Gottesmanbacteria bacterium]|nr:histone deacetylase family protein [Candidatus Gottesmanbacteria bacterium]